MTGVELTRRVPCATCGGTKKVDQLRVSRTKLFHVAQIPCSKCRGTDGTVRVAVSCASCRHWAHMPNTDKTFGFCILTIWIPNQSLLPTVQRVSICEEFENVASGFLVTHETHGCKSWTAKEGTDGR